MTARKRPKRSATPHRISTTASGDGHGAGSLIESIKRGELVAVFGTGSSLALTEGRVGSLSWRGWIEDGYRYGQKLGRIKPAQAKSWKAQLRSDDIDDLLGAAEFVCRKLDGPAGDLYARWFEEGFSSVKSSNDRMQRALAGMVNAGIPICTLNYDTLLEDVLDLPSIDFTEVSKVTNWVRREQPGVLHLHGVWNKPATCLLGIRDYSSALGDEVRELIQRSLGAFRRLLFIGCGDTFADPNFSALIRWLRGRVQTAALRHYALVVADEAAKRHKDLAWQGFVEPLVYGRDRSELPDYLLKQVLAKAGARRVATKGSRNSEGEQGEDTLASYRAFLLKDCGQMTIEGVRTDIEMAQRFDIERLFVPLSVLECSSMSQSKSKLQGETSAAIASREIHRKASAFGRIFIRAKRIALLALPGGGKTLLLKRLAVAYCSPTRREASSDALPNLSITPVLIRCREWREYIHLPMPTLLRKIPEITGQANLSDLFDALLPSLRKGSVLLLVDGLDEIHDDGARATFVENLEKFLGDYDKIRLIVTSREAGFGLVAPSINRFCRRFRIAPLEDEAITTLCDHWHTLMGGGTPEAMKESKYIALSLTRTPALRRLAENPLLLTMLLVVKHGAGRLPPDKVSLYERAVEVLLDTWNIKGHKALKVKEAVPQLAYVAYRMMQEGKQTATERQLLALLDEAREKVPQIGRYAQGSTSYDFLKRVELRSSLVLEAGHQLEDGKAVPFYQFRHLTFQEYLAAVAAFEGHYVGYSSTDTVLTPLKEVLTVEEWKEVVPMAAVLAGKQAEPIMRALVQKATAALRKPRPSVVGTHRRDNSPPIARLLSCLTEEAEAAPETLNHALRALLMAEAGIGSDDATVLARGPYGSEMLHQAYALFADMRWESAHRLPTTFMYLAFRSKPHDYWRGGEGVAELRQCATSDCLEDVVFAHMVLAGSQEFRFLESSWEEGAQALESGDGIFSSSRQAYSAAAWSRGWMALRRQGAPPEVSLKFLNRALDLWKAEQNPCAASMLRFCLCMYLGLPKQTWQPTLSEAEVGKVLEQIDAMPTFDPHIGRGFAIMMAFHSGQVWSSERLIEEIKVFRESGLGMHFARRLEVLYTSLTTTARRRMAPARDKGGKATI